MVSRVTEYRRRLKKENPDKYAEYLQKQKLTAKLRREELKAELTKKKPKKEALQRKERENELSRERQRLYIKRKAERTENREQLVVKISKPLTRKEKGEKKEYWREAKQKYRSKLTPQKRTWIKRKDRDRKQQKKLAELDKSRKTEAASSQKTVWNQTSRARAHMPKNAEQFAAVLQNLAENSSPRKRKAVEEKFTRRPSKLAKLELHSRRPGKTALKVIARKLLKKATSARSIAKQTGLHRDTIRKLRDPKCKRKSYINSHHIQNFFKREDISRVLPQKRYATKYGPGYLLQVSLKSAHSQYKEENPTEIISLAKFSALRPRNVRLLNDTHREFCLCIYCVNVRYKMLVLGRQSSPGEKTQITNESQVPQLLLCPKSDGVRFHKPECINGTCPVCKDHATTLKTYFSHVLSKPSISWNHWEKHQDPATGKVRRVLKSKTSSGEDLIEELVQDVTAPCQGMSFVQHLFNAKWQSMQYATAKQNLRENSVISVMDFAKNRTVVYQDEIKSAFFGATQVTIHPVVCHYRKGDTIIRDSLIFISEDINHDYHAVDKFFTVAQTHVEEKLGTSPVHNIVFSDGCGSQYKSRGPFADLSLKTRDINRNYFGSEHGKCEGDGEIGVLNRALDRAILSRQVIINNAEEMFTFCSESLTLEDPFSQRHFFFIKPEEIHRERPYTEVKLLPGTRKIHQMKNIPGEPYSVECRSLSCFCSACMEGRGVCVNREYVGDFNKKKLKPSNSAAVDLVLEETLHNGFPDDLVDHAIQLLAEDIGLPTDVLDLPTDVPDLPTDVPDLPTDVSDLPTIAPDLATPLPTDGTDQPSDVTDQPTDQKTRIKPSQFIYVKCPTEKKRTFHYVAQVVDVHGSGTLVVRYLYQPYKGQSTVWAWKDGDSEDYALDPCLIIKVLHDPELHTHSRTGDVYFTFQELMDV